MAMVPKAKLVPPVLLTNKVWPAVVVPTWSVPKLRADADTFNCAAPPLEAA
jgi:hypothetical protein